MYSSIYRAMRRYWPGGKIYRQRLDELERTQWLSFPELEAWQFKKIQTLVKHAFENVPFYHNLYQHLDINPNDIKYIQDFQALPFITRDDINNHLDQFVATQLKERAILNSTGGSSGQPMRFYAEKAFDWWDPALELRGRGWYGVHEGDKMAWVWGAQRDMHNWDWRARLKAKIMQERYLNAFSMTEEKMKGFAEMLVRWQPVVFRAYASALTLLAHYIKEHKISGINPKLIETTAEKVTPPQRELLEEVFQCPVADWYSAREMGTIGFECPSHGMHVCETRYLEIVANNQVVRPGELGEVVITSLNQYAMPFIRYKIGDMAIYESDPCSCGRGLPKLHEIVGRLQDFLVTTDGHFVHGGYFPHTFRNWPEISRYQVYQPDKNHLEIRLICNKKDDSAWLHLLHEELQKCFGTSMDISIQCVDEIKLTKAGKHRSIISDVRPDFV